MFKNLNIRNSLKTKNFKFQIVFGLFVYLSIGLFSTASAQTTGVTVSPSVVRLDLASDQPEATLTYTNTTKEEIALSLRAQDFTELEDSYKLSFLDKKDAQNYHYSLSSWIHFSNTTLLISPSQSEDITIFIDKDKLSPGAHYATILAEIAPQETSKKQIQVTGVMSSLLFVRTNTGKEREEARLASFEKVRNLFDFPDTFSFRFNNSGDTDLVPYGLVTVKDPWGKEIGKGIVNEASAPTLPESIRRYYVALRPMHDLLLPGMYHATISLHFGKQQKTLTASTVFFSQGSIPLSYFGGGIILVVISLLIYRKKFRKS